MPPIKPPSERDDYSTEGQAIDTTLPPVPEGIEVSGKFSPRNGLSKGAYGGQLGHKRKLSEKFLKALHDDFKEHGKDVIATVRREDPSTYLRTVAALQPKEINVTVNPLEEMTDEQLNERIKHLEAAVAGFDAPIINGTCDPSGGEKAEVRH